ncbi:MAG: hypothetical protein EXS31_01530 [Pedosphaera sp.]|nr:hypothetical protein [Pedosphaera sp.]
MLIPLTQWLTALRSTRGGSSLALLAVLAALCIGVSPVEGATSLLNGGKIRRSEQFVVQDTRPFGRSLSATWDEQNPEMVQLEPGPLLFCAERVKEGVARQLGISSRGGSEIELQIYAPRRNDENILIHSTLYANGWRYKLRVPDDLQRSRLVRGLVQVLLLEHANRGTTGKSAEIPSWLLEGLTRQVLVDVGPTLIVDGVPRNSVRRSMRIIHGADALAGVREFVRRQQPLTFTELSEPLWTEPPPDQLMRYQMSAQLFLARLIEAPDGQARLARMLRALPDCWNWQTALLRTFDFPRLVDVEKWWSVQIAAFRGNDPDVILSLDRGLARLADVLAVISQVQLDTNALPIRAKVTVSQILSEWEYAQQRPVLLRKLTLLMAMRGSAPRQLVPLLDGYAVCIQSYVQRRDRSGYDPVSRVQTNKPGPMLAREAARQLAELDKQRASFQRLAMGNDGGANQLARP